MSDTPILDPNQDQQPNPHASDNQRARGSQSSFNPLHPSMELPPEQLIRLLGVEGKKPRKKRRPATTKRSTATVPSPDSSRSQAEKIPSMIAERPAPPSTVSRKQPDTGKHRNRRADNAVFEEKRTGLLFPAAGVGVLVGAAVAAFLFLGQPSADKSMAVKAAATPEAAAPTTVSPIKRTPPAATSRQITTNTTAAETRKQPAKVTTTAAPLPAEHATQAAASPQRQTSPAAADPDTQPAHPISQAWQDAVDAEQQRLGAAAEKRFQERLQAGQQARAPEPANAAATETPVPARPEDDNAASPLPVEPVEMPADPAQLSPDTQAVEPELPATPATPPQPAPEAESTAPAGPHPTDSVTPAANEPAVDATEIPGATPLLPTGAASAAGPENTLVPRNPAAAATAPEPAPVEAVPDELATNPSETGTDSAPGAGQDASLQELRPGG